MRKFILVTSFLFLLLNQSAFAAEEAPSVSAQSAIVYQADCGRILYEKQADRKMLIASTTKIMTAILAIETCDLTESVLITQEMADVEGSSMYLKAGESYSVQELLYGLLLASGNDAATALAVHTAGDERAFAALMNE
ncbi:MAG: D-alanyl-D-alanine carboxypeptidase, partial [Oscillospiraceae bacterium]|nr:D-alanyl-D-alanine carboxypeptidase [Oscillospiraceae bacterium]